jgi:hypothetical protein
LIGTYNEASGILLSLWQKLLSSHRFVNRPALPTSERSPFVP